jgi:hypothetical protein
MGRMQAPERRSGGIGRHAGFRVQWEQSCGSSNLPFGTSTGKARNVLSVTGLSSFDLRMTCRNMRLMSPRIHPPRKPGHTTAAPIEVDNPWTTCLRFLGQPTPWNTVARDPLSPRRNGDSPRSHTGQTRAHPRACTDPRLLEICTMWRTRTRPHPGRYSLCRVFF